jgi:TP53 regulating kinase-like protein
VIGSIFETNSGSHFVKKLLGKGKSGFSYLVESDRECRVLKVMHHEPAPYYRFDDKMGSEIESYKRLRALGVPVPTLCEYDLEREYLIKEYIEGQIAAQVIASGTMVDAIFERLFAISRRLVSRGLNIDYFPTNFVVTGDDELFYIDYELNPYAEEWNLLNWGIYYWVNTPGMMDFLRTGNPQFINRDVDAGLPIKAGLQDEVDRLVARFALDHRIEASFD